MAIRQVTTPNINIPATRGWCLKYVDDAVNAPNRQPTAQRAYDLENKNGNIRTSDLPEGVWVPIFFALTRGAYAGLGHVAWAKRTGGTVEIHDSEVHGGARAPYSSIQQLLNWFGNFGIQYLGWSYWVDGVQVVEDYEPPKPVQPETGRIDAKGTATVTVDALNVRNEPSTDATIMATYSNGQTFNYDSYQVANGYVWLSYVSFSGNRRYIAEGPANGNAADVYVRGGVSR